MKKEFEQNFKEPSSISLEVWKAALLVIEKLDSKYRNVNVSYSEQEIQIKEMVLKTYADFGRNVDLKEVDKTIKEVLLKQNQRKHHNLTLQGVFYSSLPSDTREKELFLLLKRKGFFDEELQALFLNESVISQKISKKSFKIGLIVLFLSLLGCFFGSNLFLLGVIPSILFLIRSYGFNKRTLRYQKLYQSVVKKKWGNVFNFTKKIVGLKQLSYQPKLNEQVVIFERELNPWEPIDETLPNLKKAIDVIVSNPETKCIWEKWRLEGCPIREYEFLCLLNYAKPNVFTIFKSLLPQALPLLNIFRKLK